MCRNGHPVLLRVIPCLQDRAPRRPLFVAERQLFFQFQNDLRADQGLRVLIFYPYDI